METKDVLVEALRAVEAAEVPADLRETAFAKAVDLISSGPRGTAPSGGNSTGTTGSPVEAAGSGLERITAKLDLDSETVSQVYYFADGELEVIVSPGRLSTKASPATKEIALLVVAGRQATGVDPEWTAVDEIRKVCENFKKLDPSNFSTTLREMEDILSFRGSPKQREVRMSRPAWDRAAELVRRLAGNGANG